MDPFIGQLVSQGLLGLVLAAVLLRWLIPRWAYDELVEREKVKDAVIVGLNETIRTQDRTIGELGEANRDQARTIADQADSLHANSATIARLTNEAAGRVARQRRGGS